MAGENGNGEIRRNKGWDNLIPAKPGEVRNPAGRPPGRGLTDRLRKLIEEPDPDDPSKTVAERLIETVRREAMRGNWKFVEMVFDRIDGPVLRAAIGPVFTGPTIIVKGECWGALLGAAKGNKE